MGAAYASTIELIDDPALRGDRRRRQSAALAAIFRGTLRDQALRPLARGAGCQEITFDQPATLSSDDVQAVHAGAVVRTAIQPCRTIANPIRTRKLRGAGIARR